MIDPLGLPGNKSVWIFRRGWCLPRDGARSLSFSWGQLPGSHGGRSEARNLQILKKMRERERERERKRGKGGKMRVEGQNGQSFWYLKGSKFAPLRRGVGLYAAVKHRYAVAQSSTLLRTRKLDSEKKICLLRSGVEFYAVVYQKVWNKAFLFKNMNFSLSYSNGHVNPLVTVLAPFGSPEKLTNTLKTTKVESPKAENAPQSN